MGSIKNKITCALSDTKVYWELFYISDALFSYFDIVQLL